MYKRLAKALLEDICHPVCAIVSVGKLGEILYVHLFDTICCGERMQIDEQAAEIWLICNHDAGQREMLEGERRNICRAMQLARDRRVRVFFASEYWECLEIDPKTMISE